MACVNSYVSTDILRFFQHLRLELLTPLIGEAVELAVNLDRARCLEDSNRIADSKACSLVFENLGVWESFRVWNCIVESGQILGTQQIH